MYRLGVISFLSVIFCAFWVAQVKGGEEMTVQEGKLVSFDYTLTVDGEVVDSSEGREPMQYTHGEGKIIRGLSKQLKGMKLGEEKRIVVGPEEAYGPVSPSAFQEIPKSKLPSDLKPEAGMQLQAKDQTGRTSIVKIAEVKEDTVVLNLNHPLAGKTLTFEVKIVSIE